jgi:hypothetical protein
MSDSYQNQLTQVGNHIKLTVKVADLFNSQYPPSGNGEINTYTKLENGTISDYGQPKDTFSSDVKKNGAIIWIIDFEDRKERKDYNLELECIVEKKSSSGDFFDFGPLLPVANLIIATPKHGNPNDLYDYFIIFSITDNFKNSQTYAIDPQLRMT